MTDILLCSLCAMQRRGERPMHQTASGAWVCPVCDRNVPHQPTRRTKEIRARKDRP